MSEKAKNELGRAQAQWDLNPDLTLIRTAYLTGIKMTLIEEWSRKGYLVRPAAAVRPTQPPPPQTDSSTPQQTGKGKRREEADDDEWDQGPVPTIESLRREIKRMMRSRILDSLMVSQYATALGKLHGIKEMESAEHEETEEAVTIYMPREDREPDPPGEQG